MDSRIKFVSHVVKLELRFLHNKLLLFHFIITHIYYNHINLRFLYIFGGSGLLCGTPGPRLQQACYVLVVRAAVNATIKFTCHSSRYHLWASSPKRKNMNIKILLYALLYYLGVIIKELNGAINTRYH